MNKFWITIIFLFQFLNSIAQCNWSSVEFDSYESLTPIPHIIPGTTYGNTSQTYPGCVRTGSRGMYLNIVNGYTGPIYDRTFSNICATSQYRFSFSTRDAFSSTNNFNINIYDGNNILIQTLNVINNNIWQDITMPAFTVTTNTIRFQIVTITPGMSGNDIGFDDLSLNQCQPQTISNNIQQCSNGSNLDLFSIIPAGSLGTNGIWSGASVLTNGFLGTFTPGVNANGSYTYTIDGIAGCPDSIAQISVALVSNPTLTVSSNLQGCESINLPVITGANLFNPNYYSQPNQGGTVISANSTITSSQTIYCYSGLTGCSDETQITIIIDQPNSAGSDNFFTTCSNPGNFDLEILLSSDASPQGSWIEISEMPSGALNGSIIDAESLPAQVFTFGYIVPSVGSCPSDTASFDFYSGSNFEVNIGNDTTFCQGQSHVLSPGEFDSYLWDNNSTNSTRTVSTPGIYHVTVGTLGQNIIYNGDFEAGNTGFTTNYVVGSGGTWGQLSNAGTYAVNTSPNIVHSNFSACNDHTIDPGSKMMIVNGSGTPNTNVWCQTVNVQPFTDYQFSAWITSVVNDANVAQLQFKINGGVLGDIFSPTPTSCNWQQFYETWNSEIETSAQICLVNQNTLTAGNDFAIDDISFSSVCYASDSIEIFNYPNPVISATSNDTICQGEISSIIASSPTPGLTYTWNPGSINNPSLNVSPSTSTVYTVLAISSEGCISNAVSRTVLVRPTPIATIAINGNDTICAGQSVILGASATVPSNYSWSSSGNTTNIEEVAPVVTTQYTLTASSVAHGCVNDTNVTIYVIQPLEVDITGNSTICHGETTTLTVSGNQPEMEYLWSPVNSSSTSVTIDASSAGWIYVTGNYFFCPEAMDSIFVNILPNPVVTPPTGFEVCPGETVVLTGQSDQANSIIYWEMGALTGSTQSFVVTETTTFYLYAQNGACISETEEVMITVNGACDLEVPNVFTPNGDNSNDYFHLISVDGMESLTCTILNRWGNEIVNFNEPNFQWDGTNQSGEAVSDGVYFYTISAKSFSGEEFKKTGFIELKR